MPMFVRTPRHEEVIARFGTYRAYLNMLDRRQTPLQRQLRRGGAGTYEPALQSSLLAAAQFAPRPVFYDIGARIGYYSALIELVFRHQVFAFEPAPARAAIAAAIRDANGLHYHLRHQAISDVVGPIELPGLVGPAESSTLDGMWRSGLPLPGLIRIAIPYRGVAALAAGLRMIAQAKPIILCTFSPGSGCAKLAALARRLARIGYRFHSVGETRTSPEIAAEMVYDAVNSLGRRTWLMTPIELSRAFQKEVRAWRGGLKMCGAESVILLPRRESRPAEIGRDHEVKPGRG